MKFSFKTMYIDCVLGKKLLTIRILHVAQLDWVILVGIGSGTPPDDINGI